MENNWIIDYLSFVLFIGMGIAIFKGESSMWNFFYWFSVPIVYSAPITIPLAIAVKIKEFKKDSETNEEANKE